mmetsp:Transcript_8087/g.16093  ORF Transcript_8087/g.16093 Transcript_8087/m.16093 type:complete len:256 (-) Transcript_8087:241-1008(-)
MRLLHHVLLTNHTTWRECSSHWSMLHLLLLRNGIRRSGDLGLLWIAARLLHPWLRRRLLRLLLLQHIVTLSNMLPEHSRLIWQATRHKWSCGTILHRTRCLLLRLLLSISLQGRSRPSSQGHVRHLLSGHLYSLRLLTLRSRSHLRTRVSRVLDTTWVRVTLLLNTLRVTLSRTRRLLLLGYLLWHSLLSHLMLLRLLRIARISPRRLLDLPIHLPVCAAVRIVWSRTISIGVTHCPRLENMSPQRVVQSVYFAQ